MKKYLLAYALQGNTKGFCNKLSKELAEKFDVVDPHRRIPPHITLKSPFKAGKKQIKELKNGLKNFSNSHDGGNIRLEGFDHFHKRVVYVDGSANNKEGEDLLSELTNKLLGIDWLELNNHDRDLDLHVTIARPRGDEQFEEIFFYLESNLESNYNPNFQIDFDSIALLQLQKGVNQWKITDGFRL